MGEIIKILPIESLLDFILKLGFEKALAFASFLFILFLCIYLIKNNYKDNREVKIKLAEVREDQEKCHKDREELKLLNQDLNREIREARDMNRDLNRLNKESQKRISEYQSAQNANAEMLKGVFDSLLEKLNK